MGRHKWYDCIWDFKLVDPNGRVIWRGSMKNALVDQGESNMLDTYFRANNTPTQFYVRLCNDTIIETDTLSSVQNEPSGNGYAPALLERSVVGFPTLELDAGDYRVVSKEVSWTASGGDIGPVTSAYIATTLDNSGLLIAAVTLPLERTIVSGSTMYANLRIKLK